MNRALVVAILEGAEKYERIGILEEVSRAFPYEWGMATLTPTQRKFHDSTVKRVVEGDKHGAQ